MNTEHINFNLDELTSKLQKEDQRNLKLSKRMKIMLIVLIPVYFFLFVANPMDDITMNERIAGLLYVVAFSVFAAYFQYYNKLYRNVDYSLPTLEMLKQAVKRYNLFQKKILIIIGPVVCIDISTVLIAGRDTSSLSVISNNPVGFQIFYWGLMLVSFSIGCLIWYKRQKPLRDTAQLMINELEK